MHRPTARLVFPVLGIAVALGGLLAVAPLYVRTIGALGWWDLLFGGLLLAPLLLGLQWLRLNRRTPVDAPLSTRASLLAIACVSLLSTLFLLPILRVNVAAKRLRGLRYVCTNPSPKDTISRWLLAHGFSLQPQNRWSWSERKIRRAGPLDQQTWDRAMSWLAVCRTEGLDVDVPAGLKNLHAIGRLRDLAWLDLQGSLVGVDSTALGQLPKLRNLSIWNCEVSNLRALESHPKLRFLRLGNVTSGPDLSGFPSCPALQELRLNQCPNLESTAGVGRLPALRIVVFAAHRLTDLSSLVAAAPKVTGLALRQIPLLVHPESLQGWKALRRLTLSGLDFSRPESRLPALPGLQSLTLTGSRNLADFQPLLAVAPQLRSLKIADNTPMLRMEGILAQLSKLETFDASQCLIDDASFDPALFQRIPKATPPDAIYKKVWEHRFGPLKGSP